VRRDHRQQQLIEGEWQHLTNKFEFYLFIFFTIAVRSTVGIPLRGSLYIASVQMTNVTCHALWRLHFPWRVLLVTRSEGRND